MKGNKEEYNNVKNVQYTRASYILNKLAHEHFPGTRTCRLKER